MSFKLFFLISVLLPSMTLGANRDLKNIFYLDKNTRISILNDLYSATKNRYSLWDVKKANQNIDGDQIFQSALNDEQAMSDLAIGVVSGFEIAKSNINFIDRVKKTIASFQDTHFEASDFISKNPVFNGFIFAKVEGKILVSEMFAALIAKTEKDSGQEIYNSISVGDELLEINGQDVSSLVSKYGQYIGASSDAYRESSATRALTLRGFLYPEKYYSDFKFKSKSLNKEIIVRLPWYILRDISRVDLDIYSREIGIEKVEDMALKWNGRSWVVQSLFQEKKGTGLGTSPRDLIGLEVFKSNDSSSEEIIKTGYLIKERKVYGYMQFLSFGEKEVKQDSSGEVFKFKDAVNQFIRDLKDKELDLILDLRENGGGNISLSGELLKSLARKDEAYYPATFGVKVTAQAFSMISTRNEENVFFNPESPDEDYIYEQAIDEALGNNRPYTKAFAFEAHESEIGGYEGEIVALVTPDCISTCDIMSSLLKSSKRATLLGTHSNGTGAGFFFIKDGVLWKDDFGQLAFRIPNTLFGRPAQGFQLGLMDEEDSYLTQNLEGRPTVADVVYESTEEDLKNQSSGWFKKAIEVIESEKAKKGAVALP